MAGETEHRGRCLCGHVRIAITTTNQSVAACHCSMCRKWGGGPFLGVECGSKARFDGADNISVFASSAWAERGFCSTCGTHLFYRLKKEGHYFVPVGLLENGETWIFDQQIFVDEKPSFYSFANHTKNLTGTEVFAQYSPPTE